MTFGLAVRIKHENNEFYLSCFIIPITLYYSVSLYNSWLPLKCLKTLTEVFSKKLLKQTAHTTVAAVSILNNG